MGIKDLKKELTEMRISMEKMTAEIHETTIAIRESLQMTSGTIKEMSETFSKTLENALRQMSELTIQMNVKDTLLKSLGIDGMISDFFKKRK
ncbi:MAG: hypothetical protein ACFFC9_13110 [Promethearchaeota archaeon]